MKDALGSAQSLLILGGTSDIALATARRMAAGKTTRIVLAARPSARLDAAARELRAHGAEVETVAFDADAVEEHEKALGAVFAAGDIDVVLLAFGVLGDQASDEQDPVAAAKVAQTNYVGAVSSGLVCANALKKQGHGSLVVLSSVAGERARRANFIYGSTKAGLDAFAQGLGDSLHGSGVHVMVVRPGFVESKMTAGMEKAPLSTTPDAVAEAIVAGLRRGAEIVWVPAALRYVLSGLRHLPRPVFRKVAQR
ncbi:decaprenylphospho-beta-D-erythro-pentofuranosid-2-ulose 2-reductase [Actinocrinis puniceicyclus]|uniref:Decaprenylphospho-beta-D-erythro-pentofuranosid-2-ulose 2-reductase n=1 Tax=Actinocrinis puniceicyclus TaxID=977794 RepID=A0A8J8BA77_9ACTN|nr:decaprenylphospho-beta-D-erythro-pentofuranosid-2-ulose 2-reductase [Actinocrinis puniceicyclus]MBS2962662.1 decaprenylphospho-beta-D-erythro-pentofuranosid-2-ulose 2-reductase [Actinocrinis puniceicyclus]